MPAASADPVTECLHQAVETAPDAATLGEIRKNCRQIIAIDQDTTRPDESPDAIRKRLAAERKNALKPFTLTAHRPNYILLGTYNHNHYDTIANVSREEYEEISLDDFESHFQISFKTPLMIGLFDKMDIYAAYTNRSFWQVYNQDISSPFRETNHEPEAWVQFHPEWKIFGFTNTWNSFGINHQSNGQADPYSRSWNRFFSWLTLERGNLALSLRSWMRVTEAPSRDDNPDITDYLGHHELSGTYRWKDHVLSVMTRNNLESNFEKGAVQVNWSFPFWHWPYLKGYVQYFNGYGESLIDYNQHVNRIGFGFLLTDWL